jgi:hypothetical protein
VRPFGLDHVAFDNHVINLEVTISSLSFVLNVGFRTSDCCFAVEAD